MESTGGVKPTGFGKGPLIMVGWTRQEDKIAVPEGTTTLDYPGTDRDMQVRADEDSIQVSKGMQTPVVTVRFKGENIEIHREGADFDTKVLRHADEIKVDRRGTSDDITISRRGPSVMVDREGMENDVRISSMTGGSALCPLYITWDGDVIEQV